MAQIENVSGSVSTDHLVSYPRFLWRSVVLATDGSLKFYAWMIFLTALALVGVNAWANQVVNGMAVTGMSDHVSWGLYIANFTFMVGLAAGGVMMVIPAYVYQDREMHDVVIIGELLAIASIIMATAFVMVDLGRPDRFWHLIPFVGRLNFPVSMLTWDVIVLNGYLLLNLHICGYLLYMRFLRKTPNPKWYVPFVFLSIGWAISIHTVTAFLYCGLGGRPFWNTALLAPRFLASAFVSGPAFIIIAMEVIRRVSKFEIGDKPIATLVQIIRITILINLLMVVSELFTSFYTGGAHAGATMYMYFGVGEATGLVAWSWSSLLLTILAAALFMSSKVITNQTTRIVACVGAVVGIWIEKGMGLIIPGFIPSTLHEYVEYVPTRTEWMISIGIWALGMLVFTAALKIAIPVLNGDAREMIPTEKDANPS